MKHPWNFRVGGGKNIRAEVLCKKKGTKKPVYLLCDFDYADFIKRRNDQGDTSQPRLILGECFAA